MKNTSKIYIRSKRVVIKLLSALGLLYFLSKCKWNIQFIYGTVKTISGKTTIIPENSDAPEIRALPKKFNGMNGDKVVIGRLYKDNQKLLLESFVNTNTMRDNAVDDDVVDNDYQAMGKKVLNYLKGHTNVVCFNVIMILYLYIIITYTIAFNTSTMDEFLQKEIPIFYLLGGFAFIFGRIFLLRKYNNVHIVYGKAFVNLLLVNSILSFSIILAQKHYKKDCLFTSAILFICILGYYLIIQRKYVVAATNELEQQKKTFYSKLHHNASLYKYDLLEDDPVDYYKEELSRFASTDFSILLIGETGSGKGYYAELVNKLWQGDKVDKNVLPTQRKKISPELLKLRSNAPFIERNCATFSDNLVGSELFGHVKGAFTGASTQRNGDVQEANNGILFLDEIGELPVTIQGQLLTFMENKKIKPIGSDKHKKVNVRIIAATDKIENLSAPLRNRFDKIIKIPPLRLRKEDIFSLSQFLFDKVYDMSFLGKDSKRLSEGESRKLVNSDFNWRGNVRQLEKAIISALIMSKSSQGKNVLAEDIIREAIKMDDY